jgi:hypothetical protein
MTCKFIFLPLFFISQLAWCQSSFIPLNRADYHYIDRIEIKTKKIADQFNTFSKGYNRNNIFNYLKELDDDQLTKLNKMDLKNMEWMLVDNYQLEPTQEFNNAESDYPILKVIYKYKPDLFAYHTNTFSIKFNPVLNLQLAGPVDDNNLKYFNVRGFEFNGSIGNKVGFYSYLGETQWRAPNYITEYTKLYDAVPGYGYYKPFKTDAVDFMDARGYVTFKAAKIIHFTFGQDKLFLGNGIRSLFLSDNSNSQLFLKINTHYKRFDYQNIFTQLHRQDYINYDHLYPKKFAAMHHLAFNITNYFNVGVFESIVFARNNDFFELAYLNPIIFYRSVEQTLGSRDNATMGFDAKLNIAGHFQLYSSFLLDEFSFSLFKANKYAWTNKFAIQLGAKYIDVLGIKNLDMQIEHNRARPFTYTHKDILGNITHYNQPLAHPLGANFKENIFKVFYHPKPNLTISITSLFAYKGLDTSNSVSFGGNIMVPYTNRIGLKNTQNIADASYKNYIGQGAPINITFFDFVVSYQIKHNLYLDFTYMNRAQTSALSQLRSKDAYVGIGVRVNATRQPLLF